MTLQVFLEPVNVKSTPWPWPTPVVNNLPIWYSNSVKINPRTKRLDFYLYLDIMIPNDVIADNYLKLKLVLQIETRVAVCFDFYSISINNFNSFLFLCISNYIITYDTYMYV